MKRLNDWQVNRCRTLISGAIGILQLDLSAYSVLTEAGTGYFLFTPLIAAMAGCRKVFVWTRDSPYGSADEVREEFNRIADRFNVSTEFVWSAGKRPAGHVAGADIITNLGFVRPLDQELLEPADPGRTVIPLMCEAWELREQDVDITFCRNKGIRVAGTWENHPDLRIFDACGALAIKMANEAGFEVNGNRIIVWSDDHFGDTIEKAFIAAGARSVSRTMDAAEVERAAAETDFLFLCSYREQRTLVGKDGILDLVKIKKLNPAFGLVHLYGAVDPVPARIEGMNLFPDSPGRASNMSRTLAHLGPQPMIYLHAAGLKVGQLMKEGKRDPLIQPVTAAM